MDKKYWDNIATDYDAEIFSSLANDRDDVITSTITQLGRENAIACDFGCGVGKFLPILSESFRYVHAVDISDKLLDQARSNCEELTNISYHKMDLSESGSELPRVNFALCVNVVIMPCYETRKKIFQTISQCLQKSAYLVLVVPSLESALYADFRLLQWNRKAGLSEDEAVRELEDDDNSSIMQGIIEIDGVGTKHYLKEEIKAFFADISLDITSIEKVKYSWNTEFENPPKWMKQPYPWDWLTVLKKG